MAEWPIESWANVALSYTNSKDWKISRRRKRRTKQRHLLQHCDFMLSMLFYQLWFYWLWKHIVHWSRYPEPSTWRKKAVTGRKRQTKEEQASGSARWGKGGGGECVRQLDKDSLSHTSDQLLAEKFHQLRGVCHLPTKKPGDANRWKHFSRFFFHTKS